MDAPPRPLGPHPAGGRGHLRRDLRGPVRPGAGVADMSPALAKAEARFVRACARCDSAWEAWRAARGRPGNRPGTYPAEKAVIDAGERVKSAQYALDEAREIV